MSFRLVPKLLTLNDLMADTLRYFTEFGKPALRKTICGGIYARIYCIFSVCTTSLQRKFTFAISSPDEFLVFKVTVMASQVYSSCGFSDATRLRTCQLSTIYLNSRLSYYYFRFRKTNGRFAISS